VCALSLSVLSHRERESVGCSLVPRQAALSRGCFRCRVLCSWRNRLVTLSPLWHSVVPDAYVLIASLFPSSSVPDGFSDFQALPKTSSREIDSTTYRPW